MAELRVKEIINQRGISVREFAQMIGVSYATINRWENSKNEPSKLAQKSFFDFCESNFIKVEDLEKL